MAEQLDVFPQEQLESQGSIELPTKTIIEDAEWCFQFFNNEPIVFAYTEEGQKANTLTLAIEPIESEGLNFQQNGMLFKIFPRPISEKTKIERKNASENKED
jgi:hypothetical protein